MSRKEVLVVEDERDIADLLALHLKDFDCDVTVASDGHEAMRLGLAREGGGEQEGHTPRAHRAHGCSERPRPPHAVMLSQSPRCCKASPPSLPAGSA